MIVEIVNPQGKVSYTRPHDHPDVLEALKTPGYSVRGSEAAVADSLQRVVRPRTIYEQTIQSKRATGIRPKSKTANLRKLQKLHARSNPDENAVVVIHKGHQSAMHSRRIQGDENGNVQRVV